MQCTSCKGQSDLHGRRAISWVHQVVPASTQLHSSNEPRRPCADAGHVRAVTCGSYVRTDRFRHCSSVHCMETAALPCRARTARIASDRVADVANRGRFGGEPALSRSKEVFARVQRALAPPGWRLRACSALWRFQVGAQARADRPGHSMMAPASMHARVGDCSTARDRMQRDLSRHRAVHVRVQCALATSRMCPAPVQRALASPGTCPTSVQCALAPSGTCPAPVQCAPIRIDRRELSSFFVQR